MIRQFGNLFELSTKQTTYLFHVLPSGHLEHLYYGQNLNLSDSNEEAMQVVAALAEKQPFLPGNGLLYSTEQSSLCLEDLKFEMSGYGKGDIREPLIELVHSDGSRTCDFLYKEAQILETKTPLSTLPSSYDVTGTATELLITLTDAAYEQTLILKYSVFPDCDVITRSCELRNHSNAPVHIRRLLSTQLDLADSGYRFTSFHGAWAREMNRHEHIVTSGTYFVDSTAGTSSNRTNPFVILSKESATEDFGDCFACNLIYSGNHMESLSVNAYGKSRFLSGISPSGFDWIVEPNDCFEAPEAAMTYSPLGFGGISRNMHAFVREHIVRGEWKEKERPILLNSWEASYFDFNEHKLLSLAKQAKEAGAELFVLDDGWFGQRDNDTKSLGDWTVNTKKLPHGLNGLADKINALGLSFGIWVEPEMVNTDSDLYRSHPDWAIEIPGHAHSEGRNQRILDLANPAVQDNLIKQMSNVFSSANISYVKWDMNRIFSDCYSAYLTADHQGETAHRYMLGLYRIMKELTESFPHILFEGCASGGNRFDLGILCYMPQIWASDNTDAISRLAIQDGYSYGYPQSVVSAHVSGCPNHQTLRVTPLDTRFAVAAFGMLGYECNLCEMKKEELEEIKAQIALYKEWRSVIFNGTFYRLKEGNHYQWLIVSKDQKRAIGMMTQKLVVPNTIYEEFKTKGLLDDTMYHFTNIFRKHNIKQFGDLINTIAPFHIKKDSLIHNAVAKFVKMDGETEDCTVSGRILNSCGIRLKAGFGGTGLNDQVRLFQDFHSRLYFMEAVEKSEN